MRRRPHDPAFRYPTIILSAAAQRPEHSIGYRVAKWQDSSDATPHEIMAISGHRSLAEVTRYTVEAGRKGLAQRAVDRLDRIETRTETVKPSKSV